MLLTRDLRINTPVALLLVDLLRFVELGLKGKVETRGIPLNEDLEVMMHMQLLMVRTRIENWNDRIILGLTRPSRYLFGLLELTKSCEGMGLVISFVGYLLMLFLGIRLLCASQVVLADGIGTLSR